MMYISQIIVLYTLNVYSAYINCISTKLGGKRFRMVKKKKEKKFNNGIPKILNYNTVNGGIMNFIVRLDIDK